MDKSVHNLILPPMSQPCGWKNHWHLMTTALSTSYSKGACFLKKSSSFLIENVSLFYNKNLFLLLKNNINFRFESSYLKQITYIHWYTFQTLNNLYGKICVDNLILPSMNQPCGWKNHLHLMTTALRTSYSECACWKKNPKKLRAFLIEINSFWNHIIVG